MNMMFQHQRALMSTKLASTSEGLPVQLYVQKSKWKELMEPRQLNTNNVLQARFSCIVK